MDGNLRTIVNGRPLTPEEAKAIFETVDKATQDILDQTQQMVQNIGSAVQKSISSAFGGMDSIFQRMLGPNFFRNPFMFKK